MADNTAWIAERLIQWLGSKQPIRIEHRNDSPDWVDATCGDEMFTVEASCMTSLAVKALVGGKLLG